MINRLYTRFDDSSYASRGWVDWGDWLGTGRKAHQQWRAFRRARSFARSLHLESNSAWRAYCQGALRGKEIKPDDIPSQPNTVYGEHGWAGWGDWLGTGVAATRGRKYRSFARARVHARALGLANQNEWGAYCRGELRRVGVRPRDIPYHPERAYRNQGWVSYGDWLGTGYIRRTGWRSFEDARAFVSALGLTSASEWKTYCDGNLRGKPRKPPDIPNAPFSVYKDQGWKGYGDWLGTGTVPPGFRNYREFVRARSFAQSLHFQTVSEWRAHARAGKLPIDIPANPNVVYDSTGWKNWGDWLGTGRQRGGWRSFQRARRFVRALRLRGRGKWLAYCRGRLTGKGHKPPDIPASPERVYEKQGWNGIRDWLGGGKTANKLRV